ncbi:MAG: secondary thiamine-phosphate synthase enzyme YjbQ [Polyangiaceae bacterium]
MTSAQPTSAESAKTVFSFDVRSHGRGLYDFTSEVSARVRESGKKEGLCTVFVRHTSASLIVQENADPSVQTDLDAFLSRLVPDGDAIFRHTDEGPDDMPSHVRAALTATSIGIPFVDGKLMLGRWQAIYLFEHRHAPHTRQIVVHVG